MAFSLIASYDNTTPTNVAGPLNTTGANLIVVTAQDYTSGVTLSDSYGNTWILAVSQVGSVLQSYIYYCLNPTVGVGHTFTTTGSPYNGAPSVTAWSGAATSSVLGQTNGNATSTSTNQPGSVTPTVNGSLIVTGLYSSASTHSINSGFTIYSDDNANFAAAYLIQGTAGAINPTWTLSGATSATSTIAVFNPATTSPRGLFLPSSLVGLGSGGSFFSDRLAA